MGLQEVGSSQRGWSGRAPWRRRDSEGLRCRGNEARGQRGDRDVGRSMEASTAVSQASRQRKVWLSLGVPWGWDEGLPGCGVPL